MKHFAVFVLSQLACLATSLSQNIDRGQAFPQVELPSVSSPEKIDLRAQLGDKLMLHLFASW